MLVAIEMLQNECDIKVIHRNIKTDQFHLEENYNYKFSRLHVDWDQKRECITSLQSIGCIPSTSSSFHNESFLLTEHA